MTHEEILPATKSSPNNSIVWTPSGTGHRGGHLVIRTGRKSCEYIVAESQATGGRSVVMMKCEGSTAGTDGDEAAYDVFVPDAGSNYYRHCTCKGFSRHAGCKHVEALAAILENQWMPGDSPEVEPTVESVDQSWYPCRITEEEMPECFRRTYTPPPARARESMCPECGGECIYECENSPKREPYRAPHNNGIAPWM